MINNKAVMWTSNQERLLIDNPFVSTNVLSKLLGINPASVRKKKKLLGIKVKGNGDGLSIKGINLCSNTFRWSLTEKVNGKYVKLGYDYSKVVVMGVYDAYHAAVKSGYIRREAQ